jgi:molybdopterin converting factor small subunit
MPTVLVPTALRKLTSNQAEIKVAGATVGEVLRNLASLHPSLGGQILENGKVRGFVNVFVGDEDIRFLDGDATSVKEDDEVTLIPAIAGGR